MDRQVFELLDAEKLGMGCIELVLKQLRAQSPEVKARVYGQLTKGQQALMMFHVLHGHAKHSALEMYGWMGYLLTQPGNWSEITNALRKFGDEEMLQFVEEMRVIIESRGRPASLNDLDEDETLHALVHAHFIQFTSLSPLSMELIATYIRSHTDEFIDFSDLINDEVTK